MGLAAGAVATIGAITAGIGDAVATGAAFLGADVAFGAGTAAAIGSIAGPAIFGAGTGALMSAVTGGNPLTGALTGALSGGLIGGLGGATGALTTSLGSQTAADALLGAGAGAVGNAVTGGNPLTGALTGGAMGGLTGALGSSGAGGTDAALITPEGGYAVPPVPPMLDAQGNPVVDASGQTVYSTQQEADAAAGNAKLSAPGAAATNPQSSLTSMLSGKGGGISPVLALGALAAASSLFNKPQQGTYPTPTPASTAANAGNFNAPLSPAGTFPGSTAVTPNVSNYYTYGHIPGGATFYNNNNLRAYGFAGGGAMSGAANENTEQQFATGSGKHRVRGPGTETSDSIPARLSNNEYVMDAEDMRRIGHGSPERGAKILDRERKKLNKGHGALTQLASVA